MGEVAAPRCSVASLAAGERAAGTAPVTRAWLLVEQPGPWGRDAVVQSRLPRDIAVPLVEAASAAGVRVGLIRRPGHHADRAAPRTVLAAWTVPGRSWLRAWSVPDADALRTLDDAALRSLATGEEPAWGDRVDAPAMLVCTNARRDVCCALSGRPVAAALAARFPGQVWETSHLGGHRFAPTAVTLPFGTVHGRLDVGSATRVLEEAAEGRLPLDGYRGRSTWDRPGQAAEAAVRAAQGIDGLDELDVLPARPDPSAAATAGGTTGGSGDGPTKRWTVEVRAGDGRGWTATVVETLGRATRPEACGRPAVPVTALEVTALSPTATALEVGFRERGQA